MLPRYGESQISWQPPILTKRSCNLSPHKFCNPGRRASSAALLDASRAFPNHHFDAASNGVKLFEIKEREKSLSLLPLEQEAACSNPAGRTTSFHTPAPEGHCGSRPGA
jgi:hypothetical protein